MRAKQLLQRPRHVALSWPPPQPQIPPPPPHRRIRIHRSPAPPPRLRLNQGLQRKQATRLPRLQWRQGRALPLRARRPCSCGAEASPRYTPEHKLRVSVISGHRQHESSLDAFSSRSSEPGHSQSQSTRGARVSRSKHRHALDRREGCICCDAWRDWLHCCECKDLLVAACGCLWLLVAACGRVGAVQVKQLANAARRNPNLPRVLFVHPPRTRTRAHSTEEDEQVAPSPALPCFALAAIARARASPCGGVRVTQKYP